jgi:hypothetical protein
VFSEDVSGVYFSGYLPEIDAPGPDGLLHPQCVSINVAQLPEALSGANTDGRGRVGPYSDGYVMA